LREPLNPMAPADDQEIAFPCASVMVIIVLLKLACTWATPDVMFFFSRRRTRAFSLTMLYSRIVRSLKRRGRTAVKLRPAPLRMPTSSYRRSAWPGLCACAHWYGFSGRGPAARGGDVIRDSSRGPL